MDLRSRADTRRVVGDPETGRSCRNGGRFGMIIMKKYEMEILRDSWKIEMGDVGRFMRDTGDLNDIQEHQGEIQIREYTENCGMRGL
jgi:hypothetical protein